MGAQQLTQTEVPAVSSRSEAVDALRVIAAFGIVWYHSGVRDGHFIAYAGLIVFLIFAAYYEAIRTNSPPIRDTARKLLVPWLFWTCFYGVAHLVQGQQIFVTKGWGGPLAGTEIHLWFLPFIFLVVVGIRLTRDRIATPALFATGLLLISASSWRLASIYAGPPFAQWAHALPPVLFGVLLAQRTELWRMLGGVAIGACIALWSLDGVGEPYVLGGVAAIVALSINVSVPLARLAPCVMGTYLMHPAFLSVAWHLHLLPELRPMFAATGAFLATVVIRQHPIGRIISA